MCINHEINPFEKYTPIATWPNTKRGHPTSTAQCRKSIPSRTQTPSRAVNTWCIFTITTVSDITRYIALSNWNLLPNLDLLWIINQTKLPWNISDGRNHVNASRCRCRCGYFHSIPSHLCFESNRIALELRSQKAESYETNDKSTIGLYSTYCRSSYWNRRRRRQTEMRRKRNETKRVEMLRVPTVLHLLYNTVGAVLYCS